jgi:SAM-dependent methyltransferase
MQQSYSKVFYAWQRHGSWNSAKRILPIVFEAVQPKSVVDVGCGVGTWLDVARTLGVTDAVGYEGAWVKALEPAYPGLDIRAADLEQPLRGDRQFDLAMSMEVAEHLTPKRADSFVADLVALAPHVLFSAAVPGQGGNNHINEQWQSYWADKFAAHGYGPRDIIRPAVWNDRRVAYWYRQNAVLYSKGFRTDRGQGFDQVHPEHTAWYRLLHRKLFGGLQPGTSILRPS